MIAARLLLSLIACALGSCATPNDTTAINYRCDNDFSLRVALDGQQAELFLKDKTLILPRRPDMKGERYVSDDRQTLFLRKGSDAVLAVSAGHGVLRCTKKDHDESR